MVTHWSGQINLSCLHHASPLVKSCTIHTMSKGTAAQYQGFELETIFIKVVLYFWKWCRFAMKNVGAYEKVRINILFKCMPYGLYYT